MKNFLHHAAVASLPLLGFVTVSAAAAADFPKQHYCTVNQSAVCNTLLAIKNPDWTKSEDIIVLPHRGYWGLGDVVNLPENSLPSFQAVSDHGYSQTEADFTPSSRGGAAMSHDYVLTRTTNAPTTATFTYETPLETLQTYHLRDRFGNITSYGMQAGDSMVTVFLARQTVSFVDIKQKPDNDPNQYAINWVQAAGEILRQTKDTATRSVLVFKVPYTPDFIRQNLPADVIDRFYEVLWMPQVGSNSLYVDGNAPGVGTAAHSSAEFVDVWGKEAASIEAFEVNPKDTDDSRLQPFGTFANLLDYIKQKLGYRGGVFSEEPIGRRGVPNRLAIWTIKNTTTDRRGDYLFEAVGQKWGNFIVVTTDRPDIWAQVKSVYYGSHQTSGR